MSKRSRRQSSRISVRATRWSVRIPHCIRNVLSMSQNMKPNTVETHVTTSDFARDTQQVYIAFVYLILDRSACFSQPGTVMSMTQFMKPSEAEVHVFTRYDSTKVPRL